MTRSEFLTLCNSLTIDPALALESDDVRAALSRRDDDAVKMILETEF